MCLRASPPLRACFGRFGDDEKAGHGTHTAGTAAGATLSSPAETTACDDGETLSCAGACIDATESTDDLVSSYFQLYVFDIDRQCPLFGCDDDSDVCLGDDVGVTLAENGGMAQGAKLAIFDLASGEDFLADNPGNGLWEPCLEAGCKIHSNSWGADGNCIPDAIDVAYDEFMYTNPENLLIFAAGNDGENQFGTECTIGSPATAKNVLSVGATSAGETRLNMDEVYDIDHVASLSSWGFTADGRVKPEVVAPGDTVCVRALNRSSRVSRDTGQCRPVSGGNMLRNELERITSVDSSCSVLYRLKHSAPTRCITCRLLCAWCIMYQIYSAAGDGTDLHTCRLWAYQGTSMSTPVVAGASAMVSPLIGG